MQGRRGLRMLAESLLGAGLVAIICGGFVYWLGQHRLASLPPGRQILRPPHDVETLAVIKGQIWAGGRDGLAVFDANGTVAPVPPLLRNLRFVRQLLVESADIWIAHEQGISRWHRGQLQSWSTQTGSFPGQGLSLSRDRSGRLWAGSSAGLSLLRGQRFELVQLPRQLNRGRVSLLYADRQGGLWIGNDAPGSPGLLRRSSSGDAFFTTRTGLPHPSVNAVLETRDGRSLWLGTGFAGSGAALRLERGQWRPGAGTMMLKGTKVRSLYEDQQRNLWLGSEYDGVTVMSGRRRRVFGRKDGVAGAEVKAVLEYPSRTYWIGTNEGLSRFTSVRLWEPESSGSFRR